MYTTTCATESGRTQFDRAIEKSLVLFPECATVQTLLHLAHLRFAHKGHYTPHFGVTRCTTRIFLRQCLSLGRQCDSIVRTARSTGHEPNISQNESGAPFCMLRTAMMKIYNFSQLEQAPSSLSPKDLVLQRAQRLTGQPKGTRFMENVQYYHKVSHTVPNT